MRTCEATGKNIEQAIQNALLELKASREDVDIKILSEGGLFKKAKVEVSISEDALEKYEKREKFKEELKKEETTEEKIEEKKEEDFVENFMKNKIETEEKKVKIITDEEISSNEKEDEEEIERPARQEKKLTGEEFLQGVLDALEADGSIEKTEDERFVRYNVKGENLNDLIGYHGDCMMALSYLMNSACKTEDHKRIVLDIENYRKKRAESLTQLAKRVADKVVKSGRYYKFEPMDASERKVIHTALQNDDRVTTLSKGEEPHRYLIVFPKEYSDR